MERLAIVLLHDLDVVVLPCQLDKHSYIDAYHQFQTCYTHLEDFVADHVRERAHGAYLVLMPHCIEHKISSLAQAPRLPYDREPFILEPLHHARGIVGMSKAERDMAMAALSTGEDAYVTEEQARQLFHVSKCAPNAFAASRHADAIVAYTAWIVYAHSELLAVSETSCGHLPRVLCDLIVSY
jgi:hypothetical protein